MAVLGLKSVIMLLPRHYTFQILQGLLNEILCIFVAQETAINCQNRRSEKIFVARPDLHHLSAARVRVSNLFFVPPTLTSGSLAAP